MIFAKLVLGDCSLLDLVVGAVALLHNLLDVALHEVLRRHVCSSSHELALGIDEGLGVGLMEHFEEGLRVGEVELLRGANRDFLQGV